MANRNICINIIPAAKQPTIFLGFNGKRWHLLVISPTISTLFSNWSEQGYRNLVWFSPFCRYIDINPRTYGLKYWSKNRYGKNGKNRRWIIVELKNLFQLAKRCLLYSKISTNCQFTCRTLIISLYFSQTLRSFEKFLLRTIEITIEKEINY